MDKNSPERQPLQSDDDLVKRSRNDDYQINKIAKYAVLILSLTIAVVITTIVLKAIIFDPEWQKIAITAFFNSLPGIVAVVLVTIGLRKHE